VAVVALALLALACSAAVAKAASTLPPIRAFPAAGDTSPPAAAVSDPGEPDATCSPWYEQSVYVGQATGSTWWEYYCHRVWPPDGGGATNADHGGQDIFDDYFYWDGSAPVAYGYWAYFGYWDSMIDATNCSDWVDEPSGQSYGPVDESFHPIDCSGTEANVDPTASFSVTCNGSGCTFDASASSDSDGSIASYAWDFGDGATATGQTTPHVYAQPGNYRVALTVTDDRGATSNDVEMVTIEPAPPPNAPPTAAFTVLCGGLRCSLDASGSTDSDGTVASYAWDFGDGATATGQTVSHTFSRTGMYTLRLTVTDNAGAATTVDRNLTVTNTSPTAAVVVTCAALRCAFDAGASADTDGTITSYAWDFGDGTSGSGSKLPHTYPKPGRYTVTLTVTDNAGATGATSKTFNPINASAHGYKQNGTQKVDVAWNGANATSFDVYRNGNKIASLEAFTYTDTVTGKGSFTYKVCAAATSICSNDATASF
jgi:PKD repeat protein